MFLSPTPSIRPDAVEVLVRPQDQPPVADRRAGAEVTLVRQLVQRDLFERRRRLQDVRPIETADRVELVTNQHERGVEPATDASSLDFLAGFRIDARGDASVVDPKKMTLVQHSVPQTLGAIIIDAKLDNASLADASRRNDCTQRIEERRGLSMLLWARRLNHHATLGRFSQVLHGSALRDG